jgi:arylsulfatase A-like enzyme
MGVVMSKAVRADLHRSALIAAVACGLWVLTEYVLMLWAYPGGSSWLVKLRLLPVTLALGALVWLPATSLAFALALIVRLLRRLDGVPWDGPTLWRVSSSSSEPRAGVAAMWGCCVASAFFGFALQRWSLYALTHFKEPKLTAALIAAVALGLSLPATALGRGVRGVAAAGARRQRLLGRWNPLGRWLPALLLLTALVFTATLILWRSSPAVRAVLPWRLMISAGSWGAGGALALWLLALELPRPRWMRIAAPVSAGAIGAVIPLSLVFWGADPATKHVAITASPALTRLISLVRTLNDFDGDGFGSLLGENDCGPRNAAIRPGTRDLPDNGIDENCDGRDFSVRDLARPSDAAQRAVPAAFRKDWNVLLLTIDTVRYDHTTFGGYKDGPKKRDTTPRLAELVERSTSFTFTQAPSAGTMASIPAILTSKFFHSGVALDEKVKHGMPPRLRPENVLISEIMKRTGYATGAITTHEYFNDWGMEQGFDSYDNSIGEKFDPFRITSGVLTDRALAWISRNHSRKWFLWAHYLDPHGRYVAHVDSPSYGTTEEDLYDGELAYTDQQIGRLLDEIARLPGGDRTIVIITSDHGDGFNEHGFINHGQALYRELLHVPMIIHVPNNLPRKIAGATSPLDVVPTVAALCGIDVSDLQFEGESLVPQIFYGEERTDRVVFAETNFPLPIRAAIRQSGKLIYFLKNNLYEFYDLTRDPWEKNNLASKEPAAMVPLRDALHRWLERVLYARDATFNQAVLRMNELLLPSRPTPEVPVADSSFDDGRVRVLGVGPRDSKKPPTLGKPFEVNVYLEAAQAPTQAFRFQLIAWPSSSPADLQAAVAARSIRTPIRTTLDGLFPANRWQPGEYLRERFSLNIPADWTGGAMVLGLAVGDASGKLQPLQGPHPGTDATILVLGTLPVEGVAPVTVPAAPPLPGVSPPAPPLLSPKAPPK